MKSIFLSALLAGTFTTCIHAQQNKKWFIEAGPYIGIPAWSFHVGHSFGIGADARLATDFGSGFSGGAKITYAYFFGKDIGGFKVKGFNMSGLYANLQYVNSGLVVGGDIGLGYSFAGGNSEAGFARTGYLGYQLKPNDHLLTIAAYLNRTTPATYNIGVKSWFRF